MKIQDRIKLQGLQNPFMTNTTIQCKTYKVINKMGNLADITEGIFVGDVSEIKQSVIVDSEEHSKIFTKAGYRLHVSALSPQGRLLFLWLLYEIDYAEDFLELNKRRFIAECTSNYKHLSAGIKSLMDASIIIPTTVENVYWINPIFFFKGDRVKKYPNNITT
jgi:hypothetical protein